MCGQQRAGYPVSFRGCDEYDVSNDCNAICKCLMSVGDRPAPMADVAVVRCLHS